MGLDARLVSFAFVCLPVLFLFCFVFYYRKNQVITIFLQAEEICKERRRPMETRTKSMKRITGRQASSCLSIP